MKAGCSAMKKMKNRRTFLLMVLACSVNDEGSCAGSDMDRWNIASLFQGEDCNRLNSLPRLQSVQGITEGANRENRKQSRNTPSRGEPGVEWKDHQDDQMTEVLSNQLREIDVYQPLEQEREAGSSPFLACPSFPGNQVNSVCATNVSPVSLVPDSVPVSCPVAHEYAAELVGGLSEEGERGRKESGKVWEGRYRSEKLWEIIERVFKEVEGKLI
ncbi:PREDICTED: uncharacterized protein LOC109115842 [Nelumbo nucifera]|uniref:Uncharacterized protein LOC109115842 n=1 Tax=Nelumbo nucifera TaxID=4432 RepID=A0A1U8QAN2_NELNU|nr:PREDICTED: uncharacterized protein LOC109115842 [Nelumbo nucifera]